MSVASEQTMDYDRDGYVLMPNLFSVREVAGLLRHVESSECIADNASDRQDAAGKATKYALWGTSRPTSVARRPLVRAS